jgi:hypothetical protein
MQESKARETRDAELEVASTKQELQQQPLRAGEASSLASEIGRKATPALIGAVIVGGAVVAGLTFALARGKTRGPWRSSGRPSPTGMLARAVGAWLLRAAALRVAEAVVAKLQEGTSPVLAAQPEL